MELCTELVVLIFFFLAKTQNKFHVFIYVYMYVCVLNDNVKYIRLVDRDGGK